jgi:hypothetical protein
MGLTGIDDYLTRRMLFGGRRRRFRFDGLRHADSPWLADQLAAVGKPLIYRLLQAATNGQSVNFCDFHRAGAYDFPAFEHLNFRHRGYAQTRLNSESLPIFPKSLKLSAGTAESILITGVL